MTGQEKNKANAAAYAYEIELLTRALLNLHIKESPPDAFEVLEIGRRLRVLLDLEEIT